jgi:DNA-binding HxlR family transcriptional regulator/SAM-dependent methyltransferase
MDQVTADTWSSQLRELKELFSHRWDALTLLCLSTEGPLRFNALAVALNAVSDQWLADNILSRSLSRLQEGNFVVKFPDRREGSYSLTEAGVLRAALLAQYLDFQPVKSGTEHIDDDRADGDDRAAAALDGQETAAALDGQESAATGQPAAAPVDRGIVGTQPGDRQHGQGVRTAMDTSEPPGWGPTTPTATPARIWDFFLGGYHNLPADRAVAQRAIALFPTLPATAQATRAVLHRAIRHLTTVGVRQFLDIGSGIPTVGNVHEVARQGAPDSRVVYVDIDPTAVAESLEILEGNPNATAILGDLCRPADIVSHPVLRELLDLDEPTGLLLSAVVHFIHDDRAYHVVSELVGALAPGSYLLISHVGSEQTRPSSEGFKAVSADYKRVTANQLTPRTRAEVERFFVGLELLEPGVVSMPEWRPGPEGADQTHTHGWVGVAVKPSPLST